MKLENSKQNYSTLLWQVKKRVALAQQRAIYAANEELLRMYWVLSQMLHAAQQAEGWGKGTLVRLSQDMKNEYPREKGFSVRNLQFMMQFYQEYNQELTMVKTGSPSITKPSVSQLQEDTNTLRNNTITQPAVAQLPEFNFTLPIRHIHWTHNVILMQRVKDIKARYWYMQQFLIEMGAGFAFMGRQYHIAVSGDDYYLDLLMYNTFMHRYMVIELKDTDFKPEYIGKLNFYCSAVDDVLCREGDNKTIGLLLCRTKDRVKAEYALRDIAKPIGISDYELGQALPHDLRSSLPSIEYIEAELEEVSNAAVTLQGNATVNGNVFGGGRSAQRDACPSKNQGLVSSGATVNIQE